MCFFPRIFESLSPLPRQYSAAIGCTKDYQPIGVTVQSYCTESFENLLQQYVGKGWVAVDNEKNTNFPEHPVFKPKLTRTYRRFCIPCRIIGHPVCHHTHLHTHSYKTLTHMVGRFFDAKGPLKITPSVWHR